MDGVCDFDTFRLVENDLVQIIGFKFTKRPKKNSFKVRSCVTNGLITFLLVEVVTAPAEFEFEKIKDHFRGSKQICCT